MTEKLIAVTRISSGGSSLRNTLRREVSEMLKVGEKDHVGFYQINGEIVVRKIK